MNGEIKVVKKSGPGTLMQLYLLLNTPAETTKQNYNFKDHNLTVSFTSLLRPIILASELFAIYQSCTDKKPQKL